MTCVSKEYEIQTMVYDQWLQLKDAVLMGL